jgi:hypothetical protein
MRRQDYVDKAKLSPARIFKSPMDVVETNEIGPSEKLAILQAWEADEQAHGWRGARASSQGASCPQSPQASDELSVNRLLGVN